MTESFRQQDDSNFLDLLNNIRLGLNLEETVKIINRACFDPQSEEETAMTVTSRTRRSEDLNKYQLQQIENSEKVFKAKERGEFKESELPAPRELILKKEAQVIFTKNDSEGRWVNGSIGKVLDVSSKKQIEVKIQNIPYKVEREKWVKESYIYDEVADEIHTEEIAVYEQEYNIEHISIRDDYPILKEPLNIKNGFMEIPNKPGLGVELDMKMVEKLSS